MAYMLLGMYKTRFWQAIATAGTGESSVSHEVCVAAVSALPMKVSSTISLHKLSELFRQVI